MQKKIPARIYIGRYSPGNTFNLLLIIPLVFFSGILNAARLDDVKIVDNSCIILHFKDGDVVFRDDGKGKYPLSGHQNDEENNEVIWYGKELDTGFAVMPQSYMIISDDDLTVGKRGCYPDRVYRKTKMNGHAQKGWVNNDYEYIYTHEHFIYLELPHSLQQGKTYRVAINAATNSTDSEYTFTYDVFRSVSESIHLNLVGFLNSTSIKTADLYHWMGNGGARDFSGFVGKRVYICDIDVQTVHEVGEIEFWKTSGSDVGGYNLTGSDVWKVDFSTFTKPGRYRLAIENVGCSQDFEISPDIYFEPYRVSVLGFFYMRIGQDSVGIEPIPRRPLYIPGKDPQNCKVLLTTMHPYHPEWPGGGDRWDQPGFFDKYIKKDRPKNDHVWGGHSDALDWDRHLGHVSIIYDMLLPYFITDGVLEEDDLGIAESGNGIPDILDEARYEVDFWLRLRDGLGYGHGLTNPDKDNILYQAENTAIAAWANATNCAMLASCFQIAGLNDLRDEYLDSALSAWNYVGGLTDQMLDLSQDAGYSTFRGRDFKMTAAAYLFNLTGKKEFEDVVYEETVVNSGKSEIKIHEHFDQLYGCVGYLFSNQNINYPDLYENMKRAILYQARAKEAGLTERRPSRRATDSESGYFRTIQNVQRTIVAHALSVGTNQINFYESALVLEYDYGLGRNPLNMIQMTTANTPLSLKRSVPNAYTSGRDDGSEGLHPGHTPYMNLDGWACGMVMGCPPVLTKHCYPEFSKWPIGEGYFNTRYVWAHNEFTPQQTMRGKMALYGYLYAVSKK